MESQLKRFLDDLKNLRRHVKAEEVKQISKKDLRMRAEDIGSRWFNDLSTQLSQDFGFSAELIGKYSAGCARLIKLSSPNNLKTSYLEVLNELVRPFRDELILPVQQGAATGGQTNTFDAFFSTLTSPDEKPKSCDSCVERSQVLRFAKLHGKCQKKQDALRF